MSTIAELRAEIAAFLETKNLAKADLENSIGLFIAQAEGMPEPLAITADDLMAEAEHRGKPKGRAEAEQEALFFRAAHAAWEIQRVYVALKTVQDTLFHARFPMDATVEQIESARDALIRVSQAIRPGCVV